MLVLIIPVLEVVDGCSQLTDRRPLLGTFLLE
jgi:hypothetical protein